LHLTPLIPLSFKERGRNKKRGRSPLLKLLPPSPQGKGVRGMGLMLFELAQVFLSLDSGCLTRLIMSYLVTKLKEGCLGIFFN